MKGAGPGHYQSQTAEAAAFAERLSQHRDFTFDEIAANIPSELLEDISAMTMPYAWPLELQATYPLAISTLECNTRLYEDETEDILEADPLLGGLLQQKRYDSSNEDLARAIRIRRTIVVRFLLEGLPNQAEADGTAA